MLGREMANETRNNPVIEERERQTPVVANWDVCVCGGGPAGVAAAVAAARMGARTGLIENQGALGGIWTVGCLCWILDHANKSGLMQEILARLEEMGGRATRHGIPTNAYDPEKMRLLLDTLCLESGVELRLYTRVVSAVRNGSRVTHAITESKSGREAFAARVFVDATGDGDFAAAAGCGFDVGHPVTGQTQPMSLLALVAGLQPSQIRPFFRYSDEGPWAPPKIRLRREMEKAGVNPSYSMPSLFWIRDDLFMLMANHEYGVKGTDARDLTRATLDARRELHAIVEGLRKLGGPWKNMRIVATGNQIGVREGRRIHGRYTVTVDDLTSGVRHPDSVARVSFPMDVHALDGSTHKGIESAPALSRPYDIPLRALIARDVDALLMAGRCISGDFFAHSSYRVTGNAVALGEAAGKTAARAALTNRLPHEISHAELFGAPTSAQEQTD